MPGFERQQIRNEGSHLVSHARPDWATPQSLRADNPILAQQEALGNQDAQRFAQECPLQVPGPSLCPFGGVCHTCPVRVQPKLTINQPDDKYEREANRVAEQVMRMPEADIGERGTVREEVRDIHIQRSWAECDDELQRQPIEEEEEEEILQTKANLGRTPEVLPEIEAKVHALRGRQPLPKPVRAFFEPRFGYDFSHVRVRTSARANEVAGGVEARAFTVGQDIVFGAGQYSPGTLEGRRLLGHELTHVMQQSDSAVAGHGREIEPPCQVTGRGADVVNWARARPPRVSNRVTSSHHKIQRACPPPERLGRSPPPEPCVEADPTQRIRDYFGLPLRFCLDSDNLIDADRPNIAELRSRLSVLLLASGRSVHIHGYSSVSGRARYNRRLACHRASTVKRMLRLRSRAPIHLYCHGSTSIFGSPGENQRVVVCVHPPPPFHMPPARITVPRPRPPLPELEYEDCATSPNAQTVIADAFREAILLVQSALARCRQMPTPRRVVEGLAEFFNANTTVLPRVISTLETIKSELGRSHTFECESWCERPHWIAYVRSRARCWFGIPVHIHFCPPFFNSPNIETPQRVSAIVARAGSLIHEIAHISACVGDKIYYRGPGWKKKYPWVLLDNADSYSEFVLNVTR